MKIHKADYIVDNAERSTSRREGGFAAERKARSRTSYYAGHREHGNIIS